MSGMTTAALVAALMIGAATLPTTSYAQCGCGDGGGSSGSSSGGGSSSSGGGGGGGSGGGDSGSSSSGGDSGGESASNERDAQDRSEGYFDRDTGRNDLASGVLSPGGGQLAFDSENRAFLGNGPAGIALADTPGQTASLQPGAVGPQTAATQRIDWNPLTPEEARRLLEQRGYTQIGYIETYDNLYQTRALRDGQIVTLWIDPESRVFEEIANPPVAQPVRQSASATR